MVYDGQEIRLYKDGFQVGAAAQQGGIDAAPAVSAALGNQPSGAGSFPFEGSIDDVRIYSRALGQEEVRALARAFKIVPSLPAFGAFALASILLGVGLAARRTRGAGSP
jgi:hypothetical protein